MKKEGYSFLKYTGSVVLGSSMVMSAACPASFAMKNELLPDDIGVYSNVFGNVAVAVDSINSDDKVKQKWISSNIESAVLTMKDCGSDFRVRYKGYTNEDAEQFKKIADELKEYMDNSNKSLFEKTGKKLKNW